MHYLLGLLIGYLCGSLPFAVWIPRFLGQGDPREVGSGNAGATNVLRLAGRKTALWVFMADALKGFIPVLIAASCATPFLPLVVAGGCIMGHIFPWMLGFRGGKGVATMMGALLALSPLCCLLSAGVWITCWYFTGYVSLASLAATLTAVLYFFLVPWKIVYQLFAAALGGVIFFTHRRNLHRLWTKTEPKMRKP